MPETGGTTAIRRGMRPEEEHRQDPSHPTGQVPVLLRGRARRPEEEPRQDPSHPTGQVPVLLRGRARCPEEEHRQAPSHPTGQVPVLRSFMALRTDNPCCRYTDQADQARANLSCRSVVFHFSALSFCFKSLSSMDCLIINRDAGFQERLQMEFIISTISPCGKN